MTRPIALLVVALGACLAGIARAEEPAASAATTLPAATPAAAIPFGCDPSG